MHSHRVNRINMILFYSIIFSIFFAWKPGPPAGDGSDYYKIAFLIAETGKPFFDKESAELWNIFITRDELEWPSASGAHRRLTDAESRKQPHTTNEEDEWEVHHFGLYSIIAAPFFKIMTWLGFHVGYSFLIVHALLLTLGYVLLRRSRGGLELTAFFLLLILSPALWFINKPHTEFFTITLTLMAISLYLRKLYLEAALLFAAAATQNIPWCFPALLCCVIFLAQRGVKELFTKYNIFLCAAIALFSIFQPAFYLIRIGAIKPIFKSGSATFRTDSLTDLIKEMTCWWIDPNLGLLPNWWLGIAIVLLSTYLAWRGSLRLGWHYWTLVLPTSLILMYAQSSAAALNSGGTRYVSRYALWYLFLFLPLITRILEHARVWLSRRWGPATALLMFILGLANFLSFAPARQEEYLRSTRVARLLYQYLPWVYDPVPSIFRERVSRIPVPPGKIRRTAADIWAISNPECTKLLISSRALRPGNSEVPKPLFCDRAIDPNPLFRQALRESKSTESRYFYLNRSSASHEVPTYELGSWLDFSPLHGSRNSYYLGAGWLHSVPPTRGQPQKIKARATERVTSLGFRLDRSTRAGQEKLDAEAYQLTLIFIPSFEESASGLELEVSLNGESLGRRDFTEPGHHRWELDLSGRQLATLNDLQIGIEPVYAAGQLTERTDGKPGQAPAFTSRGPLRSFIILRKVRIARTS